MASDFNVRNMTSKENALRIIKYDYPEMVVSEMPVYRIEYHGVNHQSFEEPDSADGHDKPVGSRWTDIWGTSWHKEFPGVMGMPEEHPLADVSSLKSYIWPDPDDERICGKIYKMAENHSPEDDNFVFGSHRDTLWEKAYMLVGMENMMEYFYNEPEYAKEILSRIMDFQVGISKHYLNAGIETAGFSDDLGTQNSLILSPDIINEFLLPEYRRLFRIYKEKSVIINFHSCGHIEPLIDMFIELGTDILNPVQSTANDLASISGRVYKKIAVQGAVSTNLIMNGTEDAIRSEVKKVIELLGKDGGYFCSPDQYLPFPETQLKIFNEAVREFGSY